MSGEHAKADNSGPLCKTPTDESPCCGTWAANLDDLHDKLDELSAHHQTLARLTREAYGHSQQTWYAAKAIEEKVDGLIAKSEIAEARLDRIEDKQDQIMVLLRAMKAIISPD